jgi:NAD(P)-dependent dehydrogenase (short-subunit alcohol dehydrogenase family)
MKDKICVVTGSTNGIGKLTASALAEMGAEVALVSRNPEKGEFVRQELIEKIGNKKIDFFPADLSLLKEVRRVSEALKEKYDRVDVLVNNAGAYFNTFELTEEGFERTFALNHLNYFILTKELLPLLQRTSKARIVNVASDMHRGADMDFENLNGEKSYSGRKAYQCSKLANVMFTYSLANQLNPDQITVNCLHPGFVRTGFGDNNSGLFKIGLKVAKAFAAISVNRGAETSIYLASSPEVEGVTGKYFEKKKAVPSSKASYNQDAIQKLWEISERWVEAGKPIS